MHFKHLRETYIVTQELHTEQDPPELATVQTEIRLGRRMSTTIWETGQYWR